MYRLTRLFGLGVLDIVEILNIFGDVMDSLNEKVKSFYKEAVLISGLLTIYINSIDSDEINKTDLLSLLYTIDDKVKNLKNQFFENKI